MSTNALDDTVVIHRTKRRRALFAVLLGSSLLTLGAAAMSLAVFTDSKASTGSWSTGTVILGVSPTVAFSPSGIMPNSSGSQTITVSNTGTGALRYAMSAATTNADGKGLAGQLNLTVQSGTCASPGATLYSGALSGALFGNKAQGADTGDRSVAAGASDTLCFAWNLPIGTGNAFQGAATTATFTFDAEQTANN